MEFNNTEYGIVNVQNLIEAPENLNLAAYWIEKEWGYIRNKGVEFRRNLLQKFIKNNEVPNLYLLSINNEIIGFFSIESIDKCLEALLLNYLYIKPSFRGGADRRWSD